MVSEGTSIEALTTGTMCFSRRRLLGLGLGITALTAAQLRVAEAAEGLKVAAVFETPIEEPWVHQIHVALLRAQNELGIEYKWSENVAPADFGRILREYAESGQQLIMGDAFEAERLARDVARSYPNVAFVFGSGLGPAEPNFGVFDNWIQEPAYLSGMIAGKMTKTNVIGTVAAMAIPEVNRLVNAFCDGAQEVNQQVKCKVSFIGSFFDPPKAKEAALAEIAEGVDVIYAERAGVIEAAKEKGILAISNMSPQWELAPETVITGPVWNMYPTVQHVIRLVQAGVSIAQDFGEYSRMAHGGSYLAPYDKYWAAHLPAAVKEMIAKRTQEILHGTFRVPVDESTPKSA